MPHPVRICTLILCTFSAFRVFAISSENELRERIMFNTRKDSAEGANALASAILDAAPRVQAAAKNFKDRRSYELMMCDAQDALAKFVSPEAAKVLAAYLPRAQGDAAVTLCYAAKEMRADASLDAAALGMLRSGMDFRVRTALTDLLGAHKYAAAIDKIALGLNPLENPSVQIATCRALGNIQDKKAIPLLVKYIGALATVHAGGGRYRHEATAALRALTGEKLAPNAAEWKDWWDKNEKTFAMDPSKNHTPDYNYEMTEKQELEYYEVPVVENRLVIVLDCSGSMHFGGKPDRLQSAKKELTTFINALNAKQMFNIVCFSTNVRRWRKENALLFATDANKKDAIKYIEKEKESGGTNTAEAMEDALQEIAVTHGCETVYLVTDGNPNPWAPNITPEQQERLIRWINAPLKIRINTIGIYTTVKADEDAMAKAGVKEDTDKMKKFLIDIAANNDGVYREVGKDGATAVVKFDPKKEKAMLDDKAKAEKDKADKEKADKERAEKEAKEKEAKAKDEKEQAKANKERDIDESNPQFVIKKTNPPPDPKDLKKEEPKDPKKEGPQPVRSEKDFDIPILIAPRDKKPEEKKETEKKEPVKKKGEETE